VGGEVGYVDFSIKPDLNTLRSVPWNPQVAWCLGEAWTLDGSDHWPSCPRALLRRVVDAYAEHGLTPIVAPELEFFLAERDADAENGLRRYVDELSRVYTVGAVSDPREIVLKMLLWCDELGLQAFAANHEFMNSQYEINIKHSGALDAADRAFMLKAAVKEIAAREGLLATFMGRPFADQGGSGFHVHLSLDDADTRAVLERRQADLDDGRSLPFGLPREPQPAGSIDQFDGAGALDAVVADHADVAAVAQVDVDLRRQPALQVPALGDQLPRLLGRDGHGDLAFDALLLGHRALLKDAQP